MVEMRMGQYDDIEVGGIETRMGPVSKAKLLVSLEQSAIDKNSSIANLEQIPRAGDRSGRAKKCKPHATFC